MEIYDYETYGGKNVIREYIDHLTQKEQLEDTTAWITIGGKDSSGKGAYTTYTGEGGQDAIDTAIANYNKFTALKNKKTGGLNV